MPGRNDDAGKRPACDEWMIRPADHNWDSKKYFVNQTRQLLFITGIAGLFAVALLAAKILLPSAPFLSQIILPSAWLWITTFASLGIAVISFVVRYSLNKARKKYEPNNFFVKVKINGDDPYKIIGCDIYSYTDWIKDGMNHNPNSDSPINGVSLPQTIVIQNIIPRLLGMQKSLGAKNGLLRIKGISNPEKESENIRYSFSGSRPFFSTAIYFLGLIFSLLLLLYGLVVLATEWSSSDFIILFSAILLVFISSLLVWMHWVTIRLPKKLFLELKKRPGDTNVADAVWAEFHEKFFHTHRQWSVLNDVGTLWELCKRIHEMGDNIKIDMIKIDHIKKSDIAEREGVRDSSESNENPSHNLGGN
jgi:hypothetical protein